MNLFSKNRRELLGLFFTNPDRAFYMQEIGRILGMKPGVFQRTLNKLVSEGILESEYSGNARFFKVNKAYPLSRELKDIVFKTTGVAGALSDSLGTLDKIRFAFIYGSYAKSTENYLSDIDLAIVGSPDEDKLIRILDRLERKLQREINYKIYALKQFRKDIRGNEPFISELMKGKKIMIIGNADELRKISEG